MELVSLGNLPELRDDFEADWRQLPEQLAGLRRVAEKTDSDIARVESELATLPAADGIVSDAAAIQSAAAETKQIATLRNEVGEDQQKFRDSGGEAKQELRALGLDPNRLNEYELELRVSAIDAERITRLMKSESSRQGDLTLARRDVSRFEQLIEDLKRKLNELPPTGQRKRFAELVEEVNASGDPVAAVDDLERQIAGEESRITDKLACLGFCRDWRTAPSLAVPNLLSVAQIRKLFGTVQ